MKTLKTTHYTTSHFFTVNQHEVNNSNALLTNVLFEKMKAYMDQIASNLVSEFDVSPRLYKLKVLKNAYVDETLKISSYVEELIGQELSVTVLVQNKQAKRNNIICKAHFKLPVKSTINQAS